MFLAGILGAVAGAVGGLLLAPKSGKETRAELTKLAKEMLVKIETKKEETKKRVGDIWGNANDETMRRYEEIRSAVAAKSAAIVEAGKNLDRKKYEEVVEDVLGDFKTDFESGKGGWNKLVKYLKSDWKKLRAAVVASPKASGK